MTSSGVGNLNGIFVDDAEVFFYEKGDHLPQQVIQMNQMVIII